MSEHKAKYEVAERNGGGPAAMINAAITGGADLEKLEKLMLLQERWEANEAKKAYVMAMAKFKANPPKIDKDRSVNYGTTHYDHASLANVTEKINSALALAGLSAAWTTKQDGAGISVTCTITHHLGHSESTTLTAEADTSGQKNKIQAIGSTITYLERYTILALTGLATHEQDDDGKKTEVQTITEAQENELHSLIVDNINEAYVATFCKYLKVESLGDILAVNFGKAKADLKNVIKTYKGKANANSQRA
jgi:hypothetical protein